MEPGDEAERGIKRPRSRRVSNADASDDEQPRPLEPSYNPCSSCSKPRADSCSLLACLDKRVLGSQLCRRDHAIRDVKPLEHLYRDNHPRLIREVELGSWINRYDKMFALAWVDNDTLVGGTKCNKIVEISLASNPSKSTTREIPLPTCAKRRTPAPLGLEHCGVHAISISPSRTRIVTGGELPCDAVVLEATPSGTYESCGVFTGHTDWVFGVAFVTDDVFVTGSRDAKVAIWRVPSRGKADVSKLASAFRTAHNHKVRDVRFSQGSSRVGTISSDGMLNVWDPTDLQLVRTYKLAHKACFARVDTNVVCLAMDNHVAAVGSNTNVSAVDTRANVQVFEREVYEDLCKAWGVRSLSFQGHLLTIGGGSGRVHFVDMRTNRFLPLDSERGKILDAAERERARKQAQEGAGDPRVWEDQPTIDPLDNRPVPSSLRARGKLYLSTGAGHIRRDDPVYQEWYGDLPVWSLHQACYTHAWDPTGTRLAMAGGPLPSGIRGCYAAVWQS